MIGGLIPVASMKTILAEEKQASVAKQQTPLVAGLAGHVRKRWEVARDAKMQKTDERLRECVRRRRGEYSPEKLAEIKKAGGSEIFPMITSTKCRAAGSWLKDTLLGNGLDKPWTLSSTPVPDLPPDVLQNLQQQIQNEVMQFMQANGGQIPPGTDVMARAQELKDALDKEALEESKRRVERMELKMEDQLLEGGITTALNEFIDDLTTFPTAIIKGPVPRRRKKLKWNGTLLEPVDETCLEWERVSPFDIFPAPWASGPQDGPLLERHKLTRGDLDAMTGMEDSGFDDAAIRTVLSEFDGGGLRDWIASDPQRAEAEGKTSTSSSNDTDTIDALQLWDYIPGKLLIEWGMDTPETGDPTKTYPCEIWLVGSTVIKATLNYDPLGRKPYYTTSFEKVPGAFWGNGVVDLVWDSQDMCGASARALANNMGISSGPQVGINVSRLPAGEDITQMHPWKIWQFQNSDYQDSSPPISFFQPNSNAAELMQVFNSFSGRADEDSGIPKYMSGEHTPGVGRTSSGLSMLISNAGKGIKAVVSNVDHSVITPMLERLYEHNLRYATDPDLIGDVNIVARGAMSLVAREAAAVRRSEFLQLVLTSPVAQQVVDAQGLGELLRAQARLLDMNPDKVVMTRTVIDQKMQQAAAAQQAQQQLLTSQQMAAQGAGQPQVDPKQLLPDGSTAGGRESNHNVNVVTGQNH